MSLPSTQPLDLRTAIRVPDSRTAVGPILDFPAVYKKTRFVKIIVDRVLRTSEAEDMEDTLTTQLQIHDWTFAYSDDNRAYLAGYRHWEWLMRNFHYAGREDELARATVVHAPDWHPGQKWAMKKIGISEEIA